MLPSMSTNYRDLITNLDRSIHGDVTSAQSRLHGVVELLEQGRENGDDVEKYTDAIDGLRGVEQRLADLAHR